MVGNLFFFGGGEKKEGKSSFADFGFGAGGAVCKCAFSYVWGVFAFIIIVYGRILNSCGSFLITYVKILKYLANFLNSDARILNSNGSFLMICVKILMNYANFLIVGGRILNSDASFLKYGWRIRFFDFRFLLNKKSCLCIGYNSFVFWF